MNVYSYLALVIIQAYHSHILSESSTQLWSIEQPVSCLYKAEPSTIKGFDFQLKMGVALPQSQVCETNCHGY